MLQKMKLICEASATKNDESKDFDKNQTHKKAFSQDINLPSKSGADSKLLVPGKID